MKDTHEQSAGLATTPQVEGIDWTRPIPPVLAAALVKAQASIKTVDSNGVNKWHDYRYPKACDIKAMAREALAGSQLFLMLVEERLEPYPDGMPRGNELAPNPTPIGVLRNVYVLGHESGAIFPPITVRIPVFSEKGRPMDKAKNAAATNGHKYLCAGLLNMGWDDPTEDIDGRQDTATTNGNASGNGNGNRNKGRQQGQGQQGQGQGQQGQGQKGEAAKKFEGPSEYDRVYAGLRKAAWQTLEKLATFSIERDVAFSLATGSNGPMGKGLKASQLLAVIEFGQVVDMMDKTTGQIPNKHEQVAQWLAYNGVDPLWRRGEPTSRAIDFDRDCLAGRNVPQQGESDEERIAREQFEARFTGHRSPFERALAKAEERFEPKFDKDEPAEREPGEDDDDPTTADGERYDAETGEIL